MQKITELAPQLWPLLAPRVNTLVEAAINASLHSGGASLNPNPPAAVGTMQIHELSSTWHTGQLAQSQALWAVPNTRTISAGSGLGGGGDLTIDRILSVVAGEGISVASGVGLILPGVLGVASTSDSNGPGDDGRHTHAIVSSSNPGAANSLLATDTSGFLTLVRMTATDRVRAPIIDTVSGDMVITPVGDLTLNPAGNEILVPGTATIRTQSWTSGVLGTGFGIQERGLAGKSHLDIRSIYTDELYATTFIVDQIRVRMGSDWLAESLAVAARDNTDQLVTMPAGIGQFVRIYVEDAPEISGQIFLNGEYVLIKTIDRSGGGLAIRETWGVMTSYVDEANGRQSYDFTLVSGTGGFQLLVGTAITGFGVTSGSYIFRTVVEAGRGPYERFATWSGNPYTPANRVSRVEIGDIKNAAGDSTTRFGIVAGNNVGLAPSAGFSGFTADNVYGMKMFNTLMHLYDGGYLKVKLEPILGLLLLASTDGVPSTAGNAISWSPDLTAGSPSITGQIYSGSAGSVRHLTFRSFRGTQTFAQAHFAASNNSGDQAYINIQANSDGTGSILYDAAGSHSFWMSPSGNFNITRNGGTTPTVYIGGYATWHAGNFNPGNYAPLAYPTFTGVLSVPQLNVTGGDIRSDVQIVIRNVGASAYQSLLAQNFANYTGAFYCNSAASFLNFAGSSYVDIYAGSATFNGGGIYTTAGSMSFLTNLGLALPIRTGSILISSDYGHNGRVPTNGMYSLGPVLIGGTTTITSGFAFEVYGEGRMTGAWRTDICFSMKVQSSAPTPSSVYGIIYVASNGSLYYIHPNGSQPGDKISA